jgi:hypothetical protein
MSGTFARATLVAWLVIHLSWTGTLIGDAWARGDHATPEHWLYHSLLEQLGFSHHHGEGDSSSSPTHTAETKARPLASPLPSFQSAAFPAFSTVAPDVSTYSAANTQQLVVLRTLGWRLSPRDDSLPPGLRPEPEVRPPLHLP